ncbi:hypothetical protein FA15DRAFT_704890 [Coprinopsis marcescibilis]|uniref:Uncharacterized protein n=1 Tax=Coprinopsis marcescibilis TaxID=230819 RepID=A0A5C3KVA1_COPMA|nr:hypothetical protein FA15DRAFT_704890 [Coprinopsis marcescibilis]
MKRSVFESFLDYDFCFDEVSFSNERDHQLDTFVLSVLQALPQCAYQLLKQCADHRISEYDLCVIDALSQLGEKDVHFLGSIISIVFNEPAKGLNQPDSLLLYHLLGAIDGLELNWAWALGPALERKSLLHRSSDSAPIDQASDSLLLLGALHPEFITFLASPARSAKYGWGYIGQNQLVAMVRACLEALPAPNADTGALASGNMQIFWLASLVALIEDPDTVIPHLTQFYERCVETGTLDDFRPMYWDHCALQCIYRDNGDMAVVC